MGTKPDTLFLRRTAIENQRSEFQTSSELAETDIISKQILRSWERSACAIEQQQVAKLQYAPLDDDYLVSTLWEQSPLSSAVQSEQKNMIQMVTEGQMVAAIADPCGRLLWTHASRYMQKRAENLNFSAGGHWHEQAMGTNAVGLCLEVKRPVTVFSSEHYSPYVQDWVCYAAPIIHRQSGECLGVLDISTTWNKHSALGQSATTHLANSIARCLPEKTPQASLEIYALGQPKVIFNGKRINIPPRQLEILCLLALNPNGLDLQRLHHAIYGDAKITMATLKADVSRLRHCLQGQIDSRPYRLTLSVWADFIEIWKKLDKQEINEALAMYLGAFMPKSDSPEIEEWRYCIDAMMRKTVDNCSSPDELVRKIQQNSSGSTLIRERLMELLY